MRSIAATGCVVLLLLFSYVVASADQFAGYVGIGTVEPLQTVEVVANVGIGTTIPSDSLYVSSSSGGITDNGAPFNITQTQTDSHNFVGTAIGGSKQWLGQTFTTTSKGYVQSVTVKVFSIGGTPSNLVCRIEIISGGLPTGTLVDPGATATITTPSTGDNTFTFSTPFSLSPGQYAIVLEPQSVLGNGNYWYMSLQDTNVYTGGNIVTYNGSSWSADPTSDLYFQINLISKPQITGQEQGSQTFDIRSNGIGNVYLDGTSNSNNLTSWVGGNVGIGTILPSDSLYISSSSGGITDNGAPFNIAQIQTDSHNYVGTAIGGSKQWLGQTFTTTSMVYVQSVVANIFFINGAPSNLVCRIETISGGLPTGTLVDPGATVTITTPSTGDNTFTFSTPFSLSSGQYAIVLEPQSVLGNGNYWYVSLQDTNVYAGGNITTYNGSAWSADPTSDLYFQINFIGFKPQITGQEQGVQTFDIRSNGIGNVYLDGTSNSNNLTSWVAGNVGIGTVLPVGGLTVGSNKHLGTTGASKPSLSSCGTSPSIMGNDTAFTITGGATSSGCTATFGTAFNTTPTCTVTPESGNITNTFSYSVSNTAVTITESGFGTNKADVICVGHD